MSILIFLVVLFVLVLVHEWGHFIVAKKTGMRVDEFGIGFPPKAFGVKKGETEYTLNWLPIGGFVRIFGENYEEVATADVSAADVTRAFAARPKWAQALVLVAGVAMNILFAWLLFILTLMVGVQVAVDESTASDSASLYVASTLADSPANLIPSGAEVTAVSADGQTLETLQPQAFSDFVADTAPAPVDITYVYDEVQQTVTVVPAQGLSTENPERYIVGVSLALVDVQQSSFFEAIVEGTKMTGHAFVSILVGVFTLISQSVSGSADFSQVTGPIGIVDMVGDAGADTG
jgi:regulator of sigma E protease